MDYSQRVAIFDRVDHGTNGVCGFFLRVVFLLDNAVEELATSHQLHHEVDAILVLIDLEQLHHVGMVDLLLHAEAYLGQDLHLVSQRQFVVLAQGSTNTQSDRFRYHTV